MHLSRTVLATQAMFTSSNWRHTSKLGRHLIARNILSSSTATETGHESRNYRRGRRRRGLTSRLGDAQPARLRGVHALIMRHYFNGAYYPVGGAKVFADALIPVIEQAGGAIRLKAKVKEFLVENEAVVGVWLEDGTQIRAPRVFSDTGARNSVDLLPADMRNSEWAREIQSFAPSVCHVGLHLGLEGDIRANGASASNHWFHEIWGIDSGVWHDPMVEQSAPGLFISFPSLKNPSAGRRTA